MHADMCRQQAKGDSLRSLRAQRHAFATHFITTPPPCRQTPGKNQRVQHASSLCMPDMPWLVREWSSCQAPKGAPDVASLLKN